MDQLLVKTTTLNRIDTLIHAIDGSRPKCICVIGDRGSGKSTIFNYVAYSLARKRNVLSAYGQIDAHKVINSAQPMIQLRKQIVEALCAGLFRAANRRLGNDPELRRRYDDKKGTGRLEGILDYLSGQYRHITVSIDELDKTFGKIDLVNFLDEFQSFKDRLMLNYNITIFMPNLTLLWRGTEKNRKTRESLHAWFDEEVLISP